MSDDTVANKQSKPIVLIDVIYAFVTTGVVLWVLTFESVQQWLFNSTYMGIIAIVLPFIAFPAALFASRDMRAERDRKVQIVGKEIANEWSFDFCMTRKDGGKISEELMVQFWDTACSVAESKGLDIGGGFKPVNEGVTDNK